MTDQEFEKFCSFLRTVHHDLEGLIAVRKMSFLGNFSEAHPTIKADWERYCEALLNGSKKHIDLIEKWRKQDASINTR